jgi:membrane-associated phospholipid phosphatase
MKLSYLCFPPLLLLAAPSYADAQKDWDTASNIGAYSLVAVAIGAPLVKGDKNGALQAAGSVGAAQLVSLGLKSGFPELRPDGSDRKSFPSGHTATAFASAASIYERQGAKVGIPALIVATFVGLARVKADKHHWYDAVAGAGIGLTSGLLITNKPNRNIAVIPYGDTKGGGVVVAMRF